MVKLSIIIPAYNAGDYLKQLIKCLEKQIPLPDGEVEVIIIDDGSEVPVKKLLGYQAACPSWLSIIRQKNGGVSKARNKGLDTAKGEYIAFIDADDMVSERYIEIILNKIKTEQFDYCYLSWKAIGSKWKYEVRLKNLTDNFPPFNLCVWNRIYKRSLIGNTRFNEKKQIAEDAEFIRDIENGRKAFCSEIMYFYRSDAEDSLTKRFANGEINQKRIIFNLDEVKSDDNALLEEVKSLDQDSEVIIMTPKCNNEEIKKYAMVIKPQRMKATELRGNKTNLVEIIKPARHIQVAIWTKETYDIGGIETFIYEFCKAMHKYYDIAVVYEKMDPFQIQKVSKYVECVKLAPDKTFKCDILIVNRIIDNIPKNIKAKKTIQMVHGVKHSSYHVPQDKDLIVSVSEAVKDSFGEETKDSYIIRNMLDLEEPEERPLLLISTSRLNSEDKGWKRMCKVATEMDKQHISYLWICFSNVKLNTPSPNMIVLPPNREVVKWVKKADYLVQLSDHEAFCYSIAEALSVGTAIISTPLDVLPEFGFEEGKHGYTIPFDVSEDLNVKRFLKVPKFSYKFNNAESIKRWRDILGNTKPKNDYVPPEYVTLKVTKSYYDTYLSLQTKAGNTYLMPLERANLVESMGYGIREV